MPRLVLGILLLAGLAAPAAAQRDSVLSSRWVGIHLGRPVQFEFYGDSMLVVNDRWALPFELTWDSLTAAGDTVIAGQYRLVMGRLLFQTPDGMITMAPQSYLARPLDGRWAGPLGTDDDARVELVIFRTGDARWRRVPGGPWAQGEWDRASRSISFIWEDETEWTGQYDPIGNALLLDSTVTGTGLTILRRTFR